MFHGFESDKLRIEAISCIGDFCVFVYWFIFFCGGELVGKVEK
jgi:hypothetical protein